MAKMKALYYIDGIVESSAQPAAIVEIDIPEDVDSSISIDVYIATHEIAEEKFEAKYGPTKFLRVNLIPISEQEVYTSKLSHILIK
ncbi:MAG: hypothetical protein NT016_01355 [Candidatus Aenigmarchaeota archaeon]|nr:hypothetical protein [Candidatus Aenigmarchaeota archaeon]